MSGESHAATATNAAAGGAVWLYDEMCVLCSNAVRYTLRYEKSPDIRFVAIRSDEGRQIARSHAIDPDNADSFLFIENGVALRKSDGVISLVRHLSGPARLLLIGRLLPRRLRDTLYDVVARHRYQLFGRRERCELPDPAMRDRFVLPEPTPAGAERQG